MPGAWGAMNAAAERAEGAERSLKPEEPSDRELVSRAAAGDRSAFEGLYRRHVDRVYALALRMTGDLREAEVATQDVWVRVWRRLDSFRGESAFTTWLHRLARNRILDRLRAGKRRRGRAEPLDHLHLYRQGRVEDTTGKRLDLERALASLPEGARTVFVLHEVEGFKCREVADATDTAVGTVKSQLHRARKLLREALS